ncbi:MAG: HAD family hydrolase, partial [Minisyncoccales bacterium]
MEFKGAIFDLDGVITETARAHSKSWKLVFDEFLKKHSKETNKDFVPFDEEKDYLEHVDGKPRIKGVRDFLSSRKINLPEGKETDSENLKTIQGIAKKKNKLFLDILKKEKPHVYETTISFVRELKKANKKIAVISSSKNCKPVLKMAGVKNLFPVIIDGIKTKKLGLSGKPNPDIFIYAAKKLGLYPGECVVFEDALSGVEAGYKGNFGLVIGISRRGTNLHYADKIVKDLKEISI